MPVLRCAVKIILAIDPESVAEPLVGKSSGLGVIWELY